MKESLERTTNTGITAERAVAWLRTLSEAWTRADVPEAKADLLHPIYEEIVVTGRKIMSIRVTPSAYAHGLALALPDKVAMARPTGVGRAHAHSGFRQIPIEGAEEWKAAVRTSA